MLVEEAWFSKWKRLWSEEIEWSEEMIEANDNRVCEGTVKAAQRRSRR